MSHTIKGEKTVFICNSDLSGDVEIQDVHGLILAIIPGEDLRLLFEQTVRAEAAETSG